MSKCYIGRIPQLTVIQCAYTFAGSVVVMIPNVFSSFFRKICQVYIEHLS